MKLCELKIQGDYDRKVLVGILANSGYKVYVKKDRPNGWSAWDYYVVIEAVMDEEEDEKTLAERFEEVFK